MKRALVFGCTGQTGSYLCELLLDKGYAVFGVVRPGSTLRTQNIAHLLDPVKRITIVYGDVCDSQSIRRALELAQPDEVYNLAAQAHVKVSFDLAEYTGEATGMGAVRILEAIRDLGIKPRYYNAASSELFGKVREIPQKESTPFHPRSPYAAAKSFAYYTTIVHREAYGLFACNGILFNHESPRRGAHYVTRKVTLSAARIAAGLQPNVHLGNLDARRDWGYAPEYAEGIWRMLQAETPGDYVLATGETHSVAELCERAFARVRLDWRNYVVPDAAFLRPAEVDLLIGDADKAHRELGWTARTKFGELVDLMVDADVEAVARERR